MQVAHSEGCCSVIQLLLLRCVRPHMLLFLCHQSRYSLCPPLTDTVTWTQVCEVEAEMILWDHDLPLTLLVAEGELVLLHQAQLLTAGDAAIGGAPAQLGHTEHTLLVVLDESTPSPRSDGTLLMEEAGAAMQGEAEQAAPRESTVPGGVEGVTDTSQCCCLGRLMAPPEQRTLDGTGLHCLWLDVYDGRAVVRVELAEADGACGETRRMAGTLRAGHHILVCGLRAQPTSQLALCGLVQPMLCGGLPSGATITNLSCLPAALRSPRLSLAASSHSAVPTLGAPGPLTAMFPALQAAFESGSDAFSCIAVVAGWSSDCPTSSPLVVENDVVPDAVSAHVQMSSYRFVSIRLNLSEGLFADFDVECIASEAVLEQVPCRGPAEALVAPASPRPICRASAFTHSPHTPL